MIGGNLLSKKNILMTISLLVILVAVVAPIYNADETISGSDCAWSSDDEKVLTLILMNTLGDGYGKFTIDSVELDSSIREYGLCSYIITLKNENRMLIRLEVIKRYGIISGFRWITDAGVLTPIGPLSIDFDKDSMAILELNTLFSYLSKVVSKLPIRNIDDGTVSAIGDSIEKPVLYRNKYMEWRYDIRVKHGDYVTEITLMNLTQNNYLLVVNIFKNIRLTNDVTVPVRVLGASFIVKEGKAYHSDMWYMPLNIVVKAPKRTPSDVIRAVSDDLTERGYIIKNITFIGTERLIGPQYMEVTNDTLTYTKIVYVYRITALHDGKEETMTVYADPDNLKIKINTPTLSEDINQPDNKTLSSDQAGEEKLSPASLMILGLAVTVLISLILIRELNRHRKS